MLERLSRIAGQKQVEGILKHALNEQSIHNARPMNDLEIIMLAKTLGHRLEDRKLSSNSKFVQTMMEMTNLIMNPSDDIPSPDYIFWARKMLRRFQELFLMFDESKPKKRTTVH